jgi:hypothetical protein
MSANIRFKSLFFQVNIKIQRLNIPQNYNVACGFIQVFNLVLHIQKRRWIQDVREQVVEKLLGPNGEDITGDFHTARGRAS